jgi:large subunit ribosomal protein L17
VPHQVHLRILGRPADHRLSMLRNLAVAILRYERVRTTEAKAKEVRRIVDRAVNLGREGSLQARRRARGLLRDPLIVQKVFEEVAPRYPERTSGFTRLVRLGHRVGDGAPVTLIELVEGAELKAPAEKPVAEEAAPKGPLARARATARRVTSRSGKVKAATGERGAEKEKPETEKKERSAPARRRKEKSAKP